MFVIGLFTTPVYEIVYRIQAKIQQHEGLLFLQKYKDPLDLEDTILQ